MRANRTQIATVLGVALPTIDKWTRERPDGMPVVKRGRRGVAAVFDVAECVAWVRRRDAKRFAPLPRTHERQPRASRENLREILRRLWLPMDSMLPWHSGCPDVMEIREYETKVGLSHGCGEIIDWLQLGFPTLPPAEGEKGLRIPYRHAELWRLMFGGLVESSGGDGMRLELGQEMRKLCGMALPEDEARDEEGDPA